MINFIDVTIQNFQSYGNAPTTFDLNVPGSTIIHGRNLDKPGEAAASVGVGKTTLLLAIIYGLYDSVLSGTNKDGLVNLINGKHMKVVLRFSKGNKFYQIERARKMRSGATGNWVKLWEREGDAEFEDGDEITRDSASNTNEEIERIIGIPFELFVRVVTFSGSHTQFLNLPGKHPTQPSQQAFIEELFDIKTLTEKAEILKQQLRAAESEFELLQVRHQMLTEQAKSRDRRIAQAESQILNWNLKREGEIQLLQERIAELKEFDFDGQQLVFDRLEELKKQRRELTSKLSRLERDHKDATAAVATTQTELEHLETCTCPYCKQEFTSDEKIAGLKDILGELVPAIGSLTDQIQECNQSIIAIDNEVAELEPQLVAGDVKGMLEMRFKQDELIAALEHTKASENPYISVLANAQEEELEHIDTDRLNELADLIEHKKFLVKLLTKNDSFIRKALLNKNLPFLNGRLNYYLRRLELPHIVEFTQDLSTKIVRYGAEFDISSLSTGQKASVNIALSMAFRDVLQSLHTKVNLFFVDEALDVGLDSLVVSTAAKLLKEEARKNNTCMFVVSHREELATAFDRKMYVFFKDGFSKAYQGTEAILEAEKILEDS